jgi:UDP-N-acetylmuramate dehydrogenase
MLQESSTAAVTENANGAAWIMTNMADNKKLRGKMRHGEPMAQHTSWHTGGPADHYYEPADLADLSYFLGTVPAGEDLLWLGLGSNLLVRDGGFRGTVIAYGRALGRLECQSDGCFLAEAGVPCAKVARATVKQGYTGAEFLVGIPGAIGGALAMNAGAFGKEIWKIVARVQTVNRAGVVNVRTPADFRIGYRSVQQSQVEWFVSADLQLQSGDTRTGAEMIRDLLEKRSATQPMGQPSCGSVFRNPPDNYAGKLIESCGLKGKRIGQACISEKHANFIVNLGGATSADIEKLIHVAQRAVVEKYNIELIPEVKITGEQ